LDTLTTVAAVAVAAIFVYLKLQQLRTSIRDLKNSRKERTLFVAMAVGAALTIGSCVAIERANGIPFGTDPPAFTVRRILFAIFIVGFVAFNWFLTVYPDVRERNAFVAGKV
jgi:hypothetical protein